MSEDTAKLVEQISAVVESHIRTCPVNVDLNRLEQQMLPAIRQISENLLENTKAVVALSTSISEHARRLETLEHHQEKLLRSQAQTEEKVTQVGASILALKKLMERGEDLAHRVKSFNWTRAGVIGAWILTLAAIVVSNLL